MFNTSSWCIPDGESTLCFIILIITLSVFVTFPSCFVFLTRVGVKFTGNTLRYELTVYSSESSNYNLKKISVSSLVFIIFCLLFTFSLPPPHNLRPSIFFSSLLIFSSISFVLSAHLPSFPLLSFPISFPLLLRLSSTFSPLLLLLSFSLLHLLLLLFSWQSYE